MQKVIDGKSITFTQVTAKRPVGPRRVYDIEVADVHNYYANGVNVHNCDYHKMLDREGERYGVELYKLNELFITYRHRNIRFYPTGPNPTTLRGDCVVGSTFVNTDRGFVHFNELGFEEGAHATSMSVDSPYGTREVSHTYKRSVREVISCKTRNGLTISGTPEHPMLCVTPDLALEWVKLRDMQPGTWVVSRTAKSTPLFGKSQITKPQASIMGMFTANGYRESISSNDPKVVARFNKAVSKLGLTSKSTSRNRALRADTHTFSGATQKLRAWGYRTDALSAKKEIPLSVRTAPKEVLHAYLESYFMCDCGINGGATGRSANKTAPEIEVSSASKKLATQLQLILLQVYGLVGRMRKMVEVKSMGRNKQNAPKRYVTYVVTYSGYDAGKFLETFKRAKVQRYAARFTKIPKAGVGGDRRVVPYLRAALRDFHDKHVSTSKKYYTAANGTQVIRPSTKQCNLGNWKTTGPIPEALAYEGITEEYATFIKDLDPELGARLSTLLELRPHFEEVVSVQAKTKKKVVYDITVPQGHCFTANGLASHNTRLGAWIDELGLFPLPTGNEDEDENTKRANADEAHKSLTNSLVTVQSVQLELLKRGINAPPALMMGVSSPISMRDKVMRRLADSTTPEGKKYILGVNLPTWKVNPHLERDSPIIALAYASNAEKAERDFGANPPRVANTFVKPTQVSHTHWCGKQTHNLTYAYDIPGKVYAKLERIYTPKYPSVVTIDAGHVNNSFCVTGAHFDFARQKTVVSTVLEVMTHDGRSIDFNAVYLNVILPLCKDLNAVLLVADQWQSLDHLSRAQTDLGIIGGGNNKPRLVAKQFSPRRTHFDGLVAMLENGSLELPYLSEQDFDDVFTKAIEYRTLIRQPVKHLLLQLMTIRDNGVGKCPGKGEGYTDDIVRALVLQGLIHQPKVMERLAAAQNWPCFKEASGQASVAPLYVSRGGYY